MTRILRPLGRPNATGRLRLLPRLPADVCISTGVARQRAAEALGVDVAKIVLYRERAAYLTFRVSGTSDACNVYRDGEVWPSHIGA